MWYSDNLKYILLFFTLNNVSTIYIPTQHNDCLAGKGLNSYQYKNPIKLKTINYYFRSYNHIPKCIKKKFPIKNYTKSKHITQNVCHRNKGRYKLPKCEQKLQDRLLLLIRICVTPHIEIYSPKIPYRLKQNNYYKNNFRNKKNQSKFKKPLYLNSETIPLSIEEMVQKKHHKRAILDDSNLLKINQQTTSYDIISQNQNTKQNPEVEGTNENANNQTMSESLLKKIAIELDDIKLCSSLQNGIEGKQNYMNVLVLKHNLSFKVNNKILQTI